jgi:hypothetical protein
MNSSLVSRGRHSKPSYVARLGQRCRNTCAAIASKRQRSSWSDLGHAAVEDGGRGRDRTGDPLLAKQMLSQLSYTPNPIFNFEACEAAGQGRGPEVIRNCLRATLCGGTSTKLEAYHSEIFHSELVSPPAAIVSSTRLGLYRIALDSNSVSGKLSPFVPAPTWLEAARVLTDL